MSRSQITQSLLLDSDAIEDLTDEFPTLAEGYIERKDLQAALRSLGFNLPGYEIRELEKDLPKGEPNISVETLMMLHAKVKEAKDMSRNFKKDKVLKEKKELESIATEESGTGGVRKVSPAEERGFSDWMNRSLKDSLLCKSYLPVTREELYTKCADGIILCSLINISTPNTIDERTINSGDKLKSIFKCHENLVLAINSAEAIGCCVVNIFPEHIHEGRKHILLGLVWQVIRIGLLGSINLTDHAELAALLRDGETLDDLRQLTPEEILLRWVNYHLEKAGTDRRMKNFKDDIMDSEVYALLLEQIAPTHRKGDLSPVITVLQSKDNLTRAQRVLQNAETLDVAAFIAPEDIAHVGEKFKNRDRLNMAFVANLFNTYPALEMPDDVQVEIQETLEEKTYRNWMNSMGVTPYVKDLYSDLRNGLVFCQLFDVLKPGLVNWSKIVRQFDRKKRIFQMQDNCAYVIDYAKEYKLHVVNLGGDDIRQGVTILTLGLCFQMMRAYTIKMLSNLRGDGKPIEDKDIISWVNEKLQAAGKTTKITGFRDPQISSGMPILDLVDAITPDSVDYSLVSNDKEADTRFAITMARKIGARVYALPQHLEMVHQKMVMTVFACLMVLDYQKKAAS